MANRRGMGAAVGLSKEQVAFIQRGSSPAPSNIQAVEVQAASPAEVGRIERTPTPSDSSSSQPAAKRPTRRQTRPAREEPAEPDFYGQILIPLTTRLKAPTADALRRACLEQKLARKSPNSQQEIVEIAVAAWLNEHEYL